MEKLIGCKQLKRADKLRVHSKAENKLLRPFSLDNVNKWIATVHTVSINIFTRFNAFHKKNRYTRLLKKLFNFLSERKDNESDSQVNISEILYMCQAWLPAFSLENAKEIKDL